MALPPPPPPPRSYLIVSTIQNSRSCALLALVPCALHLFFTSERNKCYAVERSLLRVESLLKLCRPNPLLTQVHCRSKRSSYIEVNVTHWSWYESTDSNPMIVLIYISELLLRVSRSITADFVGMFEWRVRVLLRMKVCREILLPYNVRAENFRWTHHTPKEPHSIPER
jgi:hypothetical protein